MNIQNWQLARVVIVLVFDTLQESDISRDRLRNALPNTSPQLMDLNNILIAHYAEKNIQAAYLVDQTRLQVGVEFTSDQTDSAINKSLKVAAKVVIAARKAAKKTVLTAYGFNYISTISLVESKNVREFVLAQFSEPVNRLSKQLNSEIFALSPQINYFRDGVGYQLNLRPDLKINNIMEVNLNINIESNELPSYDNLSGLVVGYKQEFADILDRLFEEQ